MALLQSLIRDDGAGSYNSELAQYVVAAMIAEQPLWSVAQWYQMTGNADAPYTSTTGSAGGIRSIGADYPTTIANPTTDSVSLAIFGARVQTDIAFERRGIDIGSERARMLRIEAAALSRALTDQLINGTGGSQLRGLKQHATEVIDFDGPDGGLFPPDDKAQQAKFLELLRRTMIKTGCNCIIANSDFIGRLESIEREYVRYDTLTTALDDLPPRRLLSYKGVPLIDAGYNATLTNYCIPNNETLGSSEDTTSIYLVRWGEREHLSLATNIGLQVKDNGIRSNAYETLIEIDVQVAYLSPLACVRIRGIRLYA